MSSRKRWMQRSGAVGALSAVLVAISTAPAWAWCGTWWEQVATPGVCAVKGVVTGTVQSAENGILNQITNAIVDAVSWVSGEVGQAIQTGGTPDIKSAWFSSTFETTRDIGAMFALVALMCSAIYAALNRDGRELGRSVTQVMTAGVSTGVIGALVLMANAFMDYVCQVTLGATGWSSITSSLQHVADIMNKAAAQSSDPETLQLPAVVTMILGLLMIVALGTIWIEMVIRRMAIDICVIFWPLAVSGSIWTKAKQWQSRLIDTLLTVELAKPVIVILLKMASNALGSVDTASGLFLAGGLYIVAAFAPYTIMQMIGVIGGATQPGGTPAGMRAAGIGGAMALGSGISDLAGRASKAAGMLGGGGTKTPSAAGTAAAVGGPAGAAFTTGMAALQMAARPMLQAGKNLGGGNPELTSGSGGGGGGKVLEGKVIPGQLGGSPVRPALPPGKGGGGTGSSGGGQPNIRPGSPGGGNPSSGGPGTGGTRPGGQAPGGNRYAPIAPPAPRTTNPGRS